MGSRKRAKRWGFILAAAGLLFFGLSKVTAFTEKEVSKPSGAPADTKPAAAAGGKPQGKVVYLTFDDGPSEWTGEFLDVLKQNNIKATFFMQGSNLKRANLQDQVRRAVREGNYVGGHSMTHQYKKLYDEKQFVPEMKQTLSLIRQITGENPHLVRPPYGSAPGLNDKRLRDQIVQAEIKVWDWTIDSNDWNLKNRPSEIVENIKKQTKADLEVVLMHEKPQTLQVLPEIIDFYKQKGYKFAVYDETKHFHLNFMKDHRL